VATGRARVVRRESARAQVWPLLAAAADSPARR